MRRDFAWRVEIIVTYKAPDLNGEVREWTAHKELIGIGNGGMSEAEAQSIAEQKLSSDRWARQYILGKYRPAAEATYRIGHGQLYEEHLRHHWD